MIGYFLLCLFYFVLHSIINLDNLLGSLFPLIRESDADTVPYVGEYFPLVFFEIHTRSVVDIRSISNAWSQILLDFRSKSVIQLLYRSAIQCSIIEITN